MPGALVSQVLVDDDAAIDRQAGLLGQRESRPHADADDDEVGVDGGAVARASTVAPVDRARRVCAEMEHDALALRAARG